MVAYEACYVSFQSLNACKAQWEGHLQSLCGVAAPIFQSS